MLNRNERRISGAQIKTAASLAAAACYGRDETGKNVTVDNRRARGALERAFAQLIRRGGKSFVMQVSEREALGFPVNSHMSRTRSMRWLLASMRQAAALTPFRAWAMWNIARCRRASSGWLTPKPPAWQAQRPAWNCWKSLTSMACPRRVEPRP